MIEVSKRNSTILTLEQEALVRLKFPREGDEDYNISRRGLLQRMASTVDEENLGVSDLGIFSEMGHNKLNSNSSSQESELTLALNLGKELGVNPFSPRVIDEIRDVFSNVFNSRFLFQASTVDSIFTSTEDENELKVTCYEDLYQGIVKSKYPTMMKELMIKNQQQSSNRKTLIGKITSEARKTLVKKFFKKEKPKE